MKKFVSFLLVAAMAGTMAGCGSSKEAAEATTEASAESDLIDIDIDASEYVELGDYKGLTIEGEKASVSDEDVQSEIDDLRDQYVSYEEVTDRDTVQENDFLNIDYSCTINDEAIDDMSESDIDIQLGGGELVFGEELDLESALVGQKVGSEVTVKGKFDEDDDTGYGGEEATFVVTINSIEKEIYPEINDEFVQENLDYDSLEDYKKAVREDLEEQAESDVESDNQASLWEAVVANSKQIKDFPEDMVKDEEHNALIEEQEMADYLGIELGETDEEIDEYFQSYYECSLEEYAKDYLFRQCVLDLIVEKEDLQPTDEEVDAAIEEEKEAGDYESVDDVLEYSSREDFEDQIIYDRVMELLEENNTIK